MRTEPISGVAAPESLELLQQAVCHAIDLLPEANISWWRTTARIWAPPRHQELL